MLVANSQPYALSLCFELLSLFAAQQLTFFIRIAMNPLMPQKLDLKKLEDAAPPLAAIMLLWMLASLWIRHRSAYQEIQSRARNLYDFGSVFESTLLAGTIAIVATFFFREFGANLSRSFVLLFIPVSLVTLTIAKILDYTVMKVSMRKLGECERVGVVGSGPQTVRFIDRVRSADASLDIKGIILPEGRSHHLEQGAFRVLGNTSELATVINRERLDRIVIADRAIAFEHVDNCVQISKQMGVMLSHAIGPKYAGTEIAFRWVSDMQFLELTPNRYAHRREVVKRALDILIASASLILMFPVFLAIAIGIKCDSPGPVLYRSQRVGRGGKYFYFLKFRSMYDGAESRARLAAMNERGGHLFKIRNDPRVSRVGSFLRRYSLDELPQLVNVLQGEMTMVGPRPLPVEDLDPDGQSTRFQNWARERSGVLPGITGLWQIRGRSDLDFDQMVEIDTYYLRNWSLTLDISILLQTPVVVLIGRGAY